MVGDNMHRVAAPDELHKPMGDCMHAHGQTKRDDMRLPTLVRADNVNMYEAVEGDNMHGHLATQLIDKIFETARDCNEAKKYIINK